MRIYQNYIFDLYGTLIDIHTNERKPSAWRKMADIYAAYGADYSWKTMRNVYFRIVQEEEQKLSAETGCRWPEIQLENVFKKMLLEKVPAGLPKGFDEKAWLHVILYTFRVLIRERFSVYPGTVRKLEELKMNSCRIFLLSNAQAFFTRPEIEEAGLNSFFEEIYLSSDFGIRKPQPEFLQKMLEEYKLDPAETVMIGNDVSSDIRIADICGIDSVLLNTWHDTEEEIRQQFADNGIKTAERVRIILSGDIEEL